MEVIGKVGLERPRAQGKDDLDMSGEMVEALWDFF